MGLPLCGWVEKTVNELETHWLSGKKKVSGTVISKEGHADNLLGYERILISLKKMQLIRHDSTLL